MPYRQRVIALLRAALESGELQSEMNRQELELLLQREAARGWIGKIQAFDKKERFLRYAGRYVRRPPIAQRRIVEIVGGAVRFWYKRKRRRLLAQCSIKEFIDRWSQHIPKRYEHSVRQFGLFSPRLWGRNAAAIFASLGSKQRSRPKRRPWAFAIQEQFGHNPLLDRTGRLLRFKTHIAPLLLS